MTPRYHPPYKNTFRNKITKGTYSTEAFYVLVFLIGGIIFLNGHCTGKYALEEKQTINSTKK